MKVFVMVLFLLSLTLPTCAQKCTNHAQCRETNSMCWEGNCTIMPRHHYGIPKNHPSHVHHHDHPHYFIHSFDAQMDQEESSEFNWKPVRKTPQTCTSHFECGRKMCIAGVCIPSP